MRRREKNSRYILGIDPGTRNLGYGVISSESRYVASGTICASPRRPLSERLKELYEGLCGVIEEYRPTDVAVEKIFFAKSVRSALSLGHARGVALLAVSGGGFGVFEYSPLEVKKAVVGYGKADKRQVEEMVKRILGLGGRLSPDGADALALALCHLNASMGPQRLGR